MRASRIQQSQKDLPVIPDYPDSPLAGWRHYGILKAAEQKIHAQLVDVKYDGRLIGLRISYLAGNEPPLQDTYTMSYGYDVDNEESLLPDAVEELDDKFIVELYRSVNRLIAENINPYTNSFQASLDACINPRRKKVKVESRICAQGECANNPTVCVGNWRVMIKRNNGPWVCQHVDPNDDSN